MSKHARDWMTIGLVVILAALCNTLTQAQAASDLTPGTRIRVTIVQWIPTKGSYERWDPIGGEFVVSDDLSVTLPIIGKIAVGELNAVNLAAAISSQLKRQIGLVEAPQATVDIVERPPIYVVGNVEKPGEYRFRDGMTVLQGLAMSGGTLRTAVDHSLAKDRLEYAGQLKELANSLLRSQIKMVRLEAESAGAEQMDFDVQSQADPALAQAVLDHERVLHEARIKEIDRQGKSFRELRDLLVAEIETLEKKVASTDEDIASVQEQLGKIKGLVDKGLVVPARQSDLERLLRSYFSDRLDLEISIMRARQGIAETTRNLDGLHDKQATEVASALQQEKATYDQLKLKRELTEGLLLNALTGSETSKSSSDHESTFFTLVRKVDGNVVELPATETTALEPGDVVRVGPEVQPVSGDASQRQAASGQQDVATQEVVR